MPVLFDPAIRQEVLGELHLLPAIERRQRQLTRPEIARQAHSPHRPLCVAVSFRVWIGRRDVIVAIGLVALDETTCFLIETGRADKGEPVPAAKIKRVLR